RATESVVINGDDAMLDDLAAALTAPVRRFGVTSEVLAAAPRGLGYAKTTAERVAGDAAIVTSVRGRAATVRLGGREFEVGLPAKGIHYAVDAAAALEAARAVLGDR